MYWFLLKKALPFTLTFVFGAALSGLTGLLWSPEKKTEHVLTTRSYEFGSRCRMRGRTLVAESKPLNILSVPEATLPGRYDPDVFWTTEFGAGYRFPGVKMRVTFGADGQVQRVEPSGGVYPSLGTKVDNIVWESVERAARQIRFEPETVDGKPVAVTRDVKIRFAD